jgi:hypothetical protein
VLAAYWWDPIDGIDSIKPVNWLKGPGAPHARYTVSEYAPRAGDDLYWSGALSNADCRIPPAQQGQPMPPPPGVPPPPVSPPPPPVHAGDVFNSFTSQDGYAGSVELGRDLQVNLLEWNSGYLAQKNATDLYQSGNTHAGDLTVSGEFLWTGGGINYGPRAPVHNGNIVPGKFNLAATATGLAEPTNGGTVQLGSSVTLVASSSDSGSRLDMLRGAYEIWAGNGLTAENKSNLIMKAEQGAVGKLILKGKTNGGQGDWRVLVHEGATAEVTTTRPAESEQQGTVELDPGEGQGGTFFFTSGTTTIHNRTVLLLKATGVDGSGNFRQSAGVTNLQAGSHISTEGKGSVSVFAGSFLVKNLMAGTSPAAVQPDAVVTAPDGMLLSLDATLSMPDPKFNTLLVNGEFTSFGTVELAIGRSVNQSDNVVATKDIFLSNSSSLSLRWADPTAGPRRDPGSTWPLFTSVLEKVAGTPGSVTFPSEPEPLHFDLSLSADEKQLSARLVSQG